MKTIVLFILAAIPCLAMAHESSLFGFEFGKPLVLSECTSKTVADTKMYDIRPDVTCYESPLKLNGYGIPVRRIIFSQKDAPLIVKNWQMIALESHGDLIGIQFFTIGVEAQDLTLTRLTEKYGKPTAVTKRSVQNSFGATFEIIRATWKLPTINVTFDGAPERLDSGSVVIDLAEAAQMRLDWLKQEDTGRAL
jgi:hypothetical protein